MTKSGFKLIPKIIILRVFGMVLFLSFLCIANFLPFFTDNPLNYQVIQFLNENIGLVILMGITFLFGEIFNALIFPFNLPAPLFNASGSLLLVAFIFRVFSLVDILVNEKIFLIFSKIAFLIYPFVFIIVLLGGYTAIFKPASKTSLEKETANETKKDQDGCNPGMCKNATWEEVGEEFRCAVYDLLTLIRQSISKKKNEKERL